MIASVQASDDRYDFPETSIAYPATVPGQKAVVANTPTDCGFNFSVEGVIPLKPSGAFNITSVKSFLTIPGDLVSQWTNAGKSLIGFQYNAIQMADGKDWSRDFNTSDPELQRPLIGFQYLQGVSNQPLMLAAPTAETVSIEYSADVDFGVQVVEVSGTATGYDTNDANLVRKGSVYFQCKSGVGELFR